MISGSLSNPYFQIVFNGLMGFWVGLARKPNPELPWSFSQYRSWCPCRGDRWRISVYFLGSFMSMVRDFRSYLTALSPINVNFCLYGLPPIMGFLVTLVTFVVFAFLGGLAQTYPLRQDSSANLQEQSKHSLINLQSKKHGTIKLFRIFLLILGISALIILPQIVGFLLELCDWYRRDICTNGSRVKLDRWFIRSACARFCCLYRSRRIYCRSAQRP